MVRVASTKAKPDPWLTELLARRNPNVGAVALANKNAGIAWALLAHGRDYCADRRSAATAEGWHGKD